MNTLNRLFILVAILITTTSVYGKNSDNIKTTRNVIFLLVDGMSTGDLSVARWYKQVKTGKQENLALDPYICGLIRMSHTNTPIVGSAGSMSTLMTGELTSSPVVCVYPKPSDQDMVKVDASKTYTPATNIMDVARQEQDKSLGIVVSTYFCHATPAATASHAHSRDEYKEIAAQMAGIGLDVCFGGGTDFVTPQVRTILKDNNTTLIEGNDYKSFRNFNGDKLWAIMAPQSMNYDIDRPQEEPSLAEMTDKAIKMLSKNKKGFFLMVEGSQLDFAAHANDPAGIVSELLSFDDAVKVALDFAKKDKNTTVVILTDHGNASMTLGDPKFKNYSNSNIQTALGSLTDYKATSFTIAEKMVGHKTSEMASIFKEYTGVTLSKEEENMLIRVADIKQADYMEVGSTKNLVSTVAKLMTDHTHLTFATGRHTGEDVFLAVYNPNDQRPEGYHTNMEINEYVRKVLGIKKPLKEYTSQYFVPDATLFPNAKKTKNQDGNLILETVLNGNTTATFTENSNQVTVKDGNSTKTIMLKRPAVYIPRLESFYLPAEIKEQLLKTK